MAVLPCHPALCSHRCSACRHQLRRVYGEERAELGRVFAQRIVRIAEEGDEGLIVLAGVRHTYEQSVSVVRSNSTLQTAIQKIPD